MAPLIDITNMDERAAERLQDPSSNKAVVPKSSASASCIPPTASDTNSLMVERWNIISRFKRRLKRSKKASFGEQKDCASSSIAENPPSRVPPPHPGLDHLLKNFSSLSLRHQDNLPQSSILSFEQSLPVTQEQAAQPASDPPRDGASSCRGPLQECTACKQSFKSVTELTEHLFRHVYDGLLAAHWLNSAMATLLPTTSNGAPHSHVQTTFPTTDSLTHSNTEDSSHSHSSTSAHLSS